jgi:hypothetical protein
MGDSLPSVRNRDISAIQGSVELVIVACLRLLRTCVDGMATAVRHDFTSALWRYVHTLEGKEQEKVSSPANEILSKPEYSVPKSAKRTLDLDAAMDASVSGKGAARQTPLVVAAMLEDGEDALKSVNSGLSDAIYRIMCGMMLVRPTLSMIAGGKALINADITAPWTLSDMATCSSLMHRAVGDNRSPDDIVKDDCFKNKQQHDCADDLIAVIIGMLKLVARFRRKQKNIDQHEGFVDWGVEV